MILNFNNFANIDDFLTGCFTLINSFKKTKNKEFDYSSLINDLDFLSFNHNEVLFKDLRELLENEKIKIVYKSLKIIELINKNWKVSKIQDYLKNKYRFNQFTYMEEIKSFYFEVMSNNFLSWFIKKLDFNLLKNKDEKIKFLVINEFLQSCDDLTLCSYLSETKREKLFNLLVHFFINYEEDLLDILGICEYSKFKLLEFMDVFNYDTKLIQMFLIEKFSY